MDWLTVWPDYAGELEVEVGCGQGLFIEDYAKRHPTKKIVGIEVRKKVAETVQERLKERGVANVHLVHGNGEIVISDTIPDASVEKLFVFHPDPWFKKRHHNRRILNPRFLAAITQKLKPGCLLYISTDVQALFEDMVSLLNETPSWQFTEDPQFWEQEYRTNWQLFSEKDHRNSYCATYRFL